MAVTPIAEKPVRLDPFQTIVNVHFGAPVITVDFQLFFYGPGSYQPCDPSVGLPGDVDGAWYNYWWTSIYLRGSKFRDPSGIVAIAGEELPLTNWTWTGLPDYPVDALAAETVAAWNDEANIDNDLVTEEDSYQAMIFTDLPEPISGYTKGPSIEFQQWNSNWIAGPYCSGGYHNKALNAIGFVNYDNGHAFKALSQVIDFTGFRVRNEDTGKEYEAVAAQQSDVFEEHPKSAFTLLMRQVPT